MTQAHHSPEGEVIEATALVRHESIVLPAASPEQAVEAWNKYEELKRAILRDEDFLQIGKTRYPKKSAWRKLSTFFNLTAELVSEKEIKNEDGSIDFDVVYRAVAPNGRSSVGDGACNDHEKNDRNGNPMKNSRHNTRGTAHTRAYNRAVSNLIGGGEVSAEEIEQEDFRANPAPQTSPKGGLRNPEKKAGSVAGGKRVKKGGDKISEGKTRRFYAILREHGWSDLGVTNLLKEWGYSEAKEIGWKDYDEIIKALETEQEKVTSTPEVTSAPEDVPPIGDDDIPL